MFYYDLFGELAILKNETTHFMQSDYEHSDIYFPITYGMGVVPLVFGA